MNDEFVHHRGQLYVYARLFSVAPPFIWSFGENGSEFGRRRSARVRRPRLDSARRCRRLYTVEEPRFPVRSICSRQARLRTPFGSCYPQIATGKWAPRLCGCEMVSSQLRKGRAPMVTEGRVLSDEPFDLRAGTTEPAHFLQEASRRFPNPVGGKSDGLTLLDSVSHRRLGPVQLPCRAVWREGPRGRGTIRHRHGRQRQHQSAEDGDGHGVAAGGGNRLFPKCEGTATKRCFPQQRAPLISSRAPAHQYCTERHQRWRQIAQIASAYRPAEVRPVGNPQPGHGPGSRGCHRPVHPTMSPAPSRAGTTVPVFRQRGIP
jgi:hypothetical protein